MVSIIRGNWHHVKHSCRSDASDRVTGLSEFIREIIVSSVIAPNEIGATAISYRYRYRPGLSTVLPSSPIVHRFVLIRADALTSRLERQSAYAARFDR
eukprot:6183397-Pleurochrysis_carterae.AAC.6